MELMECVVIKKFVPELVRTRVKYCHIFSSRRSTWSVGAVELFVLIDSQRETAGDSGINQISHMTSTVHFERQLLQFILCSSDDCFLCLWLDRNIYILLHMTPYILLRLVWCSSIHNTIQKTYKL